MSDITYLSFSVWLTSLSIIISRSIHFAAKCLSEETLQIAEKRREAKGEGEKER